MKKENKKTDNVQLKPVAVTIIYIICLAVLIFTLFLNAISFKPMRFKIELLGIINVIVLLVSSVVPVFYVIYNFLDGDKFIKSFNPSNLNLSSKDVATLADQHLEDLRELLKINSEKVNHNIEEKTISIPLIKSTLNKPISRLVAEKNLALTVGTVSTVIAIIIFYNSLSDSPKTFSSMDDFWIYYVPRIFQSILIELFAFYFLKLANSARKEINILELKKVEILKNEEGLELVKDLESKEKAEIISSYMNKKETENDKVNDEYLFEINKLGKIFFRKV